MIKAAAAAIVAFVLLLILSVHLGTTVTATCGPFASTPVAVRGMDGAGKIGDSAKQLVDHDIDSPQDTALFVWRVISFGSLLYKIAQSHARGADEPTAATGIRVDVKNAQDAAIAACCPTSTQDPQPTDPAPVPPGGMDPTDPRVVSLQKSSGFSAEQISIARTAAQVVQQANLPPRAALVMVTAGFAESGVRNRDYGDSSSIGWLQLLDTWGTREQRLDPAFSARWFTRELVGDAVQRRMGRPWTGLSVGDAAQGVEGSSKPGAYAQYEDDAQRLLTAATGGQLGTAPDTADGSMPNPTPDDPATGGAAPGVSPWCSSTAAGAGGKVGTWNIEYGNSAANVKAGLADFRKAGADVVGLQEVSPAMRAMLATMPGWKITHNDSATPIIVGPRFSIVAQGSEEGLPSGVPVEYSPADGDRDAGPKKIVWAQLLDSQTGATAYVVNTHMLVGKKEGPRRRAAWERQMQRVADVVQEKRGTGATVWTTMDGNDPWSARSMSTLAMGAVGATASYADLGIVATHGHSTIDSVWSAGSPPSSQQLMPDRHSDHRGLLVDFLGATAASFAASVGATGPSPAGWNFPGQNSVNQAIAYMKSRDGKLLPISSSGKRTGQCLHYVGAAYGFNGTSRVNGHFYAVGQWTSMPTKYRHPGMDAPPRGALVFWKTSNVAGHIAISNGDGNVWTTDPPGKPGTIGLAPITTIDSWGTRLGYGAPFFIGKTGGTQA